MKKLSETLLQVKKENDPFSRFEEEEILDLLSLRQVRGGDGDGGEPIIIIPPPPPEP